jgi:hypothetical protein
MQNQQNIQNVKTWQAPELIELGGIAEDTKHNSNGGHADGGVSFSALS